MQESMHRRVRKSGDEQDAFSPAARKAIAKLQIPGVTAKAKDRYARRTRRDARQTLRNAGTSGLMGYGF
jgi:hypothetical protein